MSPPFHTSNRPMKSARALLLAVCFSLCTGAYGAARADWPTWRHDPQRSAASAAALPATLHLQWTRQLPPKRLAWPNEPRLHFDAAYEPVVMGNTLFVGSPVDGSVAAFDTATGRPKWRFYTNGPVRFAPVAWKGKLYVGSDDGTLYCLDAASGRLRWKARGASADRPERRHLGNARLISYWPVRGGPVIAEGTLYFAAGIWPTLGVFVVALDADTGKLLWRNGRASYLTQIRIDHNTLADSGLSPQGYLVVEGDRLLVPNGRSMPAVLDRRTGRVLRYVQGYRRGDCRVTAVDNYAFVGDAGVVDIRSGREVGSRWAAAGKDAPNAFDGSKFHLFEGPIHPYKFLPGCSARSALVPGVAYGLSKGVFYAYDLARAKTSEYESKHAGRTLKPWRWDVPALWTLATEYAKKGSRDATVVKAGPRLYSHVGSTLLALDLPQAPGARPQVSWKHDVQGTPAALLAGDGRLFVVTREHRLYCFGAREGKPTAFPLEAAPLPKKNDRWARTAAEILTLAKVSDGYCLVLGLGSGRLLEELLGQSALKVIGVDADAQRVAALRRTLVAAGLYGTRAEVFVGDPGRFPFPPYLASLVVCAGPAKARPKVQALYAVLRPYGGVACLAMPQDEQGAFESSVGGAGLANARVRRAGRFALLRREGALPGSAPWTHECGDAARSFFSRDRLLRPPLGVLWYGDGPDYGFWKRKDYGTGVKPQEVGGRLFALQLSSRTLTAYDVFTGRLLWKKQVSRFTRYASLADGIYVAGGDTCTVLDPATGAPRSTFRYPDEQRRALFVSDIRVADDLILIAAAYAKVRAIGKGLWDSALLVALDRKSGKVLWTRKAKDRFNNNAIAVGDGTVFCIDSPPAVQADKAQRRGDKQPPVPSTLLALDARTGRPKWTQVRMNPRQAYGAGNWLGLRSRDDWLAYCRPLGLVLAGKGTSACALDAKTGRAVWEKRIGGQPLILAGKTFIHQGGAIFDTQTGEPVSKQRLFTRGGCNYAVANEHLLFVRDHSAAYVDLRTGQRHHLRNVRSGCSNSFVVADGLVSVPNFAVGCVCNYPIQTSFAMVHMPEAAGWARAAAASEPGSGR